MNSESEEPHRKPVELVFHNIHDHGTKIMDMWMNEVMIRSGGRVRFTKSIGEDRELIKAADIVRDVPAMNDRYPLLNICQIPFIFPSATVGSKVVAQLYTEFSELRNELSDVKVVGLGIGALMAIFSSKAWGPIRTFEDLRGTKWGPIRNFNEDSLGARTRSLILTDGIVEDLGGKPMHVGYLEIGHLLETGQLDAAILGILPAYQFRLADGAAPYCTIAGDRSITMHPMRIYMKWDTWNGLTPDIQKIINEMGPAGADCWYAVQSGIDADNHLREALDYIKKRGELIIITTDELERWHYLLQPRLDSIISDIEARGLPARRFYDRMVELVDTYS